MRQGNSAGFVVTGGVVNDGTWNLDANVSSTQLRFDGTQTIGGTGEFVLSDSSANVIRSNANTDILTLAGTQTIRGAGALQSNIGGFVNDGAIRQQGTTELRLDPGSTDVDGFGANFVNNGVLRSEGTGGMTLVNSVYRNNTTIETTGGGDIRLNAGTEIRGGNLSASGGGVIDSQGGGVGPLLSGVTITAGTSVVQSNGEGLRIQNDGLTNSVNNGTIVLDANVSATHVTYIGTQNLTGTGEIVMSDSVANEIRVNSSTDVLTLDTDQTIRGAGRILSNIGGFINNGTILQQGSAALTIDPGFQDVDGNGANFVNNGVLRSEGTGGLILNQANYQNNSTIEAVGGGNICLASSATEIRGGILLVSGGGVVDVQAGPTGSILRNVTVGTGTTVELENGEGLRIADGIANNGTLALNSTVSTTQITAVGSQTIGGSGEIVMTDSGANRIVVNSSTDVITLGANQTIRGAGNILANLGGFINQGTIIADQLTNEIVLDAGVGPVGFWNEGVLRASGAAGLNILGGAGFTQAAGLTDIQAASRADVTLGDYVQTGGETRVNGIMSVNGSNSEVDLQGGRFSGSGLVDFDGLGVHVLNNTGGTLAAGNSPGVLTIQDGDYVQGAGGTFEFELNGFTAGVEHDLLTIVNGDADLGGDLNIIADQLFASTLNIGDQFEVVRLDSSGVFLDGDLDLSADVFDTLTINLGGLNFTQFFGSNTIGGTSLFLQVVQADVLPPGVDPVPEPAPLLVMLFGVAGLAYARRRRAA